MKHRDEPPNPHETSDDCPITRLAETDLVAVDLCGCGMLQLHIHALTLRMTPDAIAELRFVLERAARVQSRPAGSEDTVTSYFGKPRTRGNA